MQTENEKPEVKVRAYFLQQGQSIGKLHDILDSSLLSGYLKRGLSIFIEIILFLIFLCLLLVVIYIPLDPIQIKQALSDTSSATTTIHDDDITGMMMVIKAILFIAALMPFFLMLLLRRNRKKGTLIHTAFEEVESMKKKFDKAVKDLSL